MDLIFEFMKWFWAVNADALIIPFAKANAIPIAAVWVVLKWWVKRTPSTEDDALIESLRAVLPMMKNR